MNRPAFRPTAELAALTTQYQHDHHRTPPNPGRPACSCGTWACPILLALEVAS